MIRAWWAAKILRLVDHLLMNAFQRLLSLSLLSHYRTLHEARDKEGRRRY